MKKQAQIIGISSDLVEVRYQNTNQEKIKVGLIPKELLQIDAFITIDEEIAEGEGHIFISEGEPFELLCTCPTTCDCQNPPPADWDGISGSWGISEYCPIHNEHPKHDENCPVHG